MLELIRKSKYSKILSILIAIQLFGFFQPLQVFALTSGPAQPEFQGFSPISNENMVDLSSGDFSYNIDLITLPGPNGGYPLKMAYNAGATMEQEASWVGLGWSLNTGAIIRNVKGVPDDHKGDIYEKTYYTKPNISVSGTYDGKDTELFGFSMGKLDKILDSEAVNNFIEQNSTTNIFELNYNNKYGGTINSYNGFSIDNAPFEITFFTPNQEATSEEAYLKAEELALKQEQVEKDLLMDYTDKLLDNECYNDSLFNIAVKMSEKAATEQLAQLALDKKILNSENQFFRNYLSLSNINDLKKNQIAQFYRLGNQLGNTAYSTYATASSQTPSSNIPIKNVAFNITGKYGNEQKGKTDNHAGFFMYKSQSIEQPTRNLNAFGYLNCEKVIGSKNIILDYSIENNSVVNKNSKFLPRSVTSPDLYTIQGQQMNGTFRASRADIGSYHNETIESNSSDNGFAGDFGAGESGDLKFGGNTDLTDLKQYNGTWRLDNGNIGFADQFSFKFSEDNRVNEHIYYKFIGESTSFNDTRYQFFKNFNASRIDIKKNKTKSASILSNAYAVGMVHNESTGNISNFSSGVNKERIPRNTLIEYFTKKELTQLDRPTAFLSNACKDHHIAEYNITNPNGMKFKYQAGAYNLIQKDVMFAVDGSNASSSSTLIDYYNSYLSINGLDPSITCVYPSSRDKYYTATKVSPFAHSYLLKEITSQDYIDKTDDGLTNDDQGYWVKFSYTDTLNMKWRAPFTGAYLSRNHLSDDKDDKASYSYGEKEVRYTKKIETKTHYVDFYMSDREDAKGPNKEHNFSSSTNTCNTNRSLKQLDSLALFSKNDPTTPIKTVILEHVYSLCTNVPNSSASSKGKLTLDKVYFVYGKNRKGKSNAYKFEYENANYNYNTENSDCWGYYSSTNTIAENNFVKQDDDANLDAYANAWNLKKITLPSGGEIEIEYEMDDYAYVQGRQAQRYFKILGFGGLASEDSKYEKLKNTDESCKVYFDPGGFNVSKFQDIRHFLPSVNHKPFVKIFMKLKSVSTGNASLPQPIEDYVDGYVAIETVGYDVAKNLPYIRIVLPEGQDNMKIHPIRFLGFSHLFAERPDLNDGFVDFDNMGVLSIGNSLIANMKQKAEKFISPMKMYRISGYCKNAILHDNSTTVPPSFIRLNEPDYCKKGGGHRVKSITMRDNWTIATSQSYTYKTNYTYKTKKETSLGIYRTISSGVAENEPFGAKGENPLYQPIYYGLESVINKQYVNFTDEPIGINSYPSPNVKYSKVVVQTETPNDASLTNAGSTVYEFYTAKDFPIESFKTDIESVMDEPKHPVLKSLIEHVPFAKYNDVKKYGFSQGFKVIFNDMHGKAKSISTYPSDVNVLLPESKAFRSSYTNYEYFLSNDGKKLNNEINCLKGDCNVEKMSLGIDYDASVYTDEGFYLMESRKDFANLDVLNLAPAPPLPVPMYYNYKKTQEREFKVISFNEIIRKQGILKRVTEQKDGLTHVKENLMFDAYTGTPLLITSQNNYDKPVYQYSFPAHWQYNDIGLNFTNYRKRINGIVNTMDSKLINAYFHEGDIVQIETNNQIEYCYIDNIDTDAAASGGNVISFINCISNNASTVNLNIQQNFYIVESGKSNLNATSSGGFSSLQNPISNRRFPVLDTIQNLIGGYTNPNLSIQSCPIATEHSAKYKYRDCNGTFIDVRLCYFENSTYDVLEFANDINSLNGNECEQNSTNGCTARLIVDGNMNLTNINQIQSFSKKGKEVEISYITGIQTQRIMASWDDKNACFTECMDDVLNAQASEFKKYTESDNNYWRQYLANLYSVDRKQKGEDGRRTNIRKDGVFDYFEIFKWNKGNDNNEQGEWRWQNKTTRFDNVGFEVESVDALGIYSTAEYGYDNSLVKAIVNNARKNEVLSENFEHNTYTTFPIDIGTPQHKFSIDFQGTGGYFAQTATDAHTGDKSIAFEDVNVKFSFDVVSAANADNLSTNDKSIIENKDYLLSFWVRLTSQDIDQISFTSNTTITETNINENPIDGWHKIDIHFNSSNTQDPVTIQMAGNVSSIDDIRLHPYNSQMISYVYNPINYRLRAQLDENNFASIYNYDMEGILVQSKKETIEGIKTISTNRQFIKKNNN